MKKSLLIILILSLLTFYSNSQITINQGGTVNVNGGETFYDAGGAAGTDGNTSYTITLNPSAGKSVCIDFSSFNSMGKLEIFDGSTTASKNIGTLKGNYSAKYNAGDRTGQEAVTGASAEFKPGIFCANNASGTLTLKYTPSGGGRLGWVGTISTYTNNSGCQIDITANNTSICSGANVQLTATGQVSGSAVSNNFNGSTIGTGWNATPSGVSFVSVLGCEPNGGFTTRNTDNSIFAWMQNVAAPRVLETNNFDVSLGGFISFDFRMASDDNGGNGCEVPDDKEGVYVQYSTNNGATWNNMKLMFPAIPGGATILGCGDYVFNWNKTTFPIPAAAQTASTKFRWYQGSASRNVEDSWGVDNVVISLVKPYTISIYKNPTGLSNGTLISSSNTSPYSITDAPTATTIY